MPLAGCSRFDLLNAAVPRCGYVKTSDVAYGPRPRQTLDIYRPKGTDQPAGVVVFFYGGSWQMGSKADYRFVAQALASRGFIAVLPDYRLYPNVTFPAFVEDAARAVRWVYDHAEAIGGDRRHLYLMGHSAGAHIAALLTLDERYLRAVGLEQDVIRATAALSGPYDFIPTPDNRDVFRMVAGQKKPPVASQPIRFADGNDPPLLLIHGAEDETVRPGNARRLAERLRSVGGQVETKFYADRGHVGILLALAWPFRWYAPTLDDVTAFFRAHGANPR